jgi:hypothetical protein
MRAQIDRHIFFSGFILQLEQRRTAWRIDDNRTDIRAAVFQTGFQPAFAEHVFAGQHLIHAHRQIRILPLQHFAAQQLGTRIGRGFMASGFRVRGGFGFFRRPVAEFEIVELYRGRSERNIDARRHSLRIDLALSAEQAAAHLQRQSRNFIALGRHVEFSRSRPRPPRRQ